MYSNIAFVCSTEHRLVNQMQEGGLILIDKIRIYTKQYTVQKGAQFTISPALVDYSTGEIGNAGTLFRSGWNIVEGQGAFANKDGVNVDIRNGRMTITFNPGPLINGNNYFPVSYAEFIESIIQVKNILLEIGIVTELHDCRLSRIDLFRNIETNQEFETYKPVLKFIRPKNMPNQTAKFKKNSFLIRNQSRQYFLYNKLAQLLEKGINPIRLGILLKHVFRAEVRFMNNKSIKNSLGFETLGDLTTQNSYDNLINQYRHIMSDDFFRWKSTLKQIGHFDSDIDLLHQLKTLHSRGAVDYLLIHKLMTGDKPYNPEILAEVMQQVGYSRSSAFEKKQKLISLQNLTACDSDTMSNLGDLLREIHDKIVA